MDVKIEKLVYGGEGLGHAEGNTVFVPFVLPEETVCIDAVERKKKFVRGALNSIITPSAERIEPRCPHFYTCGGCHYQHIPPEAQLRYKEEILRDTLRRIGHIDWREPITLHASPPWGYRNRAQWKVRPAGRDEKQSGKAAGKLEIGYFRAGSVALVPVHECAVLSIRLENALKALRNAFLAGEFPSSIREVEAFADGADENLLLTVSFAGFPATLPHVADTLRAHIPNIASILFHDTSRERMELVGRGYLNYQAAGNSYRVGHMSFFQVNRFLIDEMVASVVGAEMEGEMALDLFCGVGLFTLPLTQRFRRVVGVESNPATVRDLELNLTANARRAEIRNAGVDEFLRKFTEPPQLVIMDPPRAGLTSESLSRLVRLRPERITYVSCEPSTLARDLAALSKSAYAVKEVHLFDLFPQTFHIETVVKLARR